MDKFKIETSMQFPFLKMNELVTYSEVKKPSGVAYILLVLISESKNKADSLSKVLENLGIPQKLHYIFADTIQYLSDQGIIEIKSYCLNFDSFCMSDFKFTEKGRKIFAEESISTGVNKEEKISIFYNIARNELSLKLDDDLEAKPLMNCAIDPEFVDQFKCKKDIETFLNLQKGNGIPIKKEEIITKVQQMKDSEKWIGKYNCDVDIFGDGVDIIFDDKVLEKFFHKYYSGDIISHSISFKSKFKFKSSYNVGLKLSSYGSNEITDILIPKNIDNILKQQCKLLLTKGKYKSSNSVCIVNSESVDCFDKTVEFVQVDMNNIVFAYVPGIFEFKNNDFGIINIPLVLKLKYSFEDLKSNIIPYLNELREYSKENFKSLIQITNITRDGSSAGKIIEGYLNNSFESNIVLLNEMKIYALSSPIILQKYKELLYDNYFNYLSNVTEDGLETFLKITNSVPKFLNISNRDLLNKLFEKLVVNNPIKTYELLVDKGFDKSVVSLYVNPIPALIRTGNAEEKSLIDFMNYQHNIDKLKEITGIDDYQHYEFDIDNVKRDDFKTTFNNVFNLSKTVHIFEKQNKVLFIKYDGFEKLFGTINDYINMMEASMNNPNNITPKLIDKKINLGDFQFVFVNISAKLENILKNKYYLDGKLSNMLTKAGNSGLIEKNIVSDLHNFRKNRNAYVHPRDRKPNCEANDLRRWSKEVFELEERKK